MFRHWRTLGKLTVNRDRQSRAAVSGREGRVGQSTQSTDGEKADMGAEHLPLGLLTVPQPDTMQRVPATGQWEEMVMGLTF